MDYDEFFSQIDLPSLQFWLGLSAGLVFGIGAALANFCVRRMSHSLYQGKPDEAAFTWLLGLSTTLLLTNLLLGTESTDMSEARQASAAASLSGPIIGGLLFGIGMVISRGCSSRMLILTTRGNLRALTTLLVFAILAYLVYGGALAFIRPMIQNLWFVETDTLILPQMLGLPEWLVPSVALVVAIYSGWRLIHLHMWGQMIGALLVGLAIASAWAATAFSSFYTFGEVPSQSISYTAPMAELVAAILAPETFILRFEFGLILGTFMGAGIITWVRGDWQLQTFSQANASSASPMAYPIGGAFMGFGAVFAGGCSIGAGLSGSSILALPSLIALLAIVCGGLVAYWVGGKFSKA